jgi:hypothetical protein
MLNPPPIDDTPPTPTPAPPPPTPLDPSLANAAPMIEDGTAEVYLDANGKQAIRLTAKGRAMRGLPPL